MAKGKQAGRECLVFLPLLFLIRGDPRYGVRVRSPRAIAFCLYFGENGCFAVSFLLRISSILGSPRMARWMDSLVAS